MSRDESKKRPVSVSGMLDKLGVSKSGYYGWLHREPSKAKQRKENIKKELLAAYEESKYIYGAPKLTKSLNAAGVAVSERTVTRYMKELGIHACYARPYTVTTVSEDFSAKLQNVLKREFNPKRPDAVWCTDITYIPTEEGFAYLSCVMDLYSRKIIAWTLADSLEARHVVCAIEKAKAVRKISKALVLHTDRGVQYTSEEYGKATESITTSYSRKGNPWDNACIESFHALIKREWLNRFKIRDIYHAHALIFEYIDAFYNTRRIHSHCGYLSPQEYEAQYESRAKQHLGDAA